MTERYASTKLKHTNNRDHGHDVTPFCSFSNRIRYTSPWFQIPAMRPNDAMPQKFPEFPGALQELPGPPGVRSQKVQRVILSIPSALPSEGKLEKV